MCSVLKNTNTDIIRNTNTAIIRNTNTDVRGNDQAFIAAGGVTDHPQPSLVMVGPVLWK